MLHESRVYSIDKVETRQELAKKLTNTTWCLCSGFEFGGYLWLNDSISEDSAQEYAVIRNGRQVESITFTWCTTEEAAEHIRDVLAGKHVDMGKTNPQIDPSEGHWCHLCQ